MDVRYAGQAEGETVPVIAHAQDKPKGAAGGKSSTAKGATDGKADEAAGKKDFRLAT